MSPRILCIRGVRMSKHFSVAIDGPSGAGKSTIARAAAKRFGFIYVDTGAMYRTVGLAAARAGMALGDEGGVVGLLPELGALAAEVFRRVGVGQQDLHDAFASRLRIEGNGILRHPKGGGGGVIIGLLNQGSDVIFILIKVADMEHRFRSKAEQGIP